MIIYNHSVLSQWVHQISIVDKNLYGKISQNNHRPVGWGCRIRWLHLCIGAGHPTSEATCWPWVATHKALGRNPVIDPATEWSMACNTPLWPLLGLTGGRIGPDPINRLVPISPCTYVCFFLPIILYDLLLLNYSICSCRNIPNSLFHIY